MTLPEIKQAIPHREPFLLVDEVIEMSETMIRCRKSFRGDEFWYRGHYPDFPITPGVLLCEAAMQAGAILLSPLVKESPGKIPVATRADRVQFKRMVRPGETVEIEVTLLERVSSAFYLSGKVTVAGQLAARLDFACTMAEPSHAR